MDVLTLLGSPIPGVVQMVDGSMRLDDDVGAKKECVALLYTWSKCSSHVSVPQKDERLIKRYPHFYLKNTENNDLALSDSYRYLLFTFAYTTHDNVVYY